MPQLRNILEKGYLHIMAATDRLPVLMLHTERRKIKTEKLNEN